MLHLIRTKQKSIIVRIIFWVIIAAFVGTVFLVWGRGGEKGPTAGATALQVNDTAISYDAYQSTYNNLTNLYRSVYSEQFTPQLEQQLNLPQQALDQLIRQALMEQEAERVDIEVTQNELVESIAAIPAFQDNGKFNRERYIQVLNYQRMSPEQFETSQRRQLIADKLREQLQQGLSITSAEIETAFRKENDKVNLNFVRLQPPLFESKVKISEAQLEEYFKANPEDFRQPERIALRYLQFDPADYKKEDANFSEEELQRYYRRNLDLFEIKEQVKAAHILIKVEPDAAEEQKNIRRALAESILRQLKEGKEFAALARANSDDPGSAGKGGDLGYFSRGTMVAPFEKAVFSMKPGELSDIVETRFGYHIIKLEDFIEPGVKPLAQVLDEVRKGLRTEQSRRLAYEKAMDAYNINRKSGDLDAAAKANGLEVKDTRLFDRTEAIEGIGREEEIISAAFNLEKGELAQPVQTTQGVFLFTIKERKQSRIPELKEARSAVEEAYRKSQASKLARKAAAKLLEAAKATSLSTAARKAGYQIEETGLFSSSYGDFVPRIGSSQKISATAFRLTGEAPLAEEVFKQGKNFILVSLKQAESADMSKLNAKKRSKIEERLLTEKKQAAVDDKLEELRDAARISIDPALDNDLNRRQP